MIVADCIAKFLAEKKIKHVFGYQGGAIAKIIHSIVETNEVEYIQNYHEQASSFAASGYARVTGDIGVAIGTSGPGAVNLIAGIADSYCDSIPCLFITGQDHSKNILKPKGPRLHGFQDLDIVSMVKTITKYSKIILDENEVLYELEKACYIAKSGRCGPVLLDIPVDIQLKEVNLNNQKMFVQPDINLNEFELHKTNEVIDLISKSQRPVILCGGGVRASGSTQELSKMVSALKIPVVATSNGLDANENMIGFSGLNGNTQANLAIFNADLILVLGARLGQQQVGKIKEQYTKAKIVHIDVDKFELGRIFADSFQVCSDLKLFLTKLNAELSHVNIPNFSQWKLEVEGYREKFGNDVNCNQGDKIDPVAFVKHLGDILNDDAILTLDVGQNQMWVSQGVKLKSDQRMLSGVGYGSMGCSIPYAIGATFAANKNRQVVSFNGDGGFQMNSQELMLISDKKLNIKIVIFNNGGLGLIKGTQDKYMDCKYYGTNEDYFKCVNIDLLSKAYDIKYQKITSLADIENIKDLMQNQNPCIIEVACSGSSKLLSRADLSKLA